MKIIDPLPYIWRDMQKREITRAELARRLNMSRSGVSKMLKGHTQIGLPLLIKLSAVLGTDYVLLLAPNYQSELLHLRNTNEGLQKEAADLKTQMGDLEHQRKELEQEINVLRGKLEVYAQLMGAGKND